jgi:K+-transporting ATPase c subunit
VGRPFCRFVGSSVRWFVGSLVRRFVGSLVRRFVGSGFVGSGFVGSGFADSCFIRRSVAQGFSPARSSSSSENLSQSTSRLYPEHA